MSIQNPVPPPPPRAQLCDKVPSFDSGIAMKMIQDELGRPWQEVHLAGSSAERVCCSHECCVVLVRNVCCICGVRGRAASSADLL